MIVVCADATAGTPGPSATRVARRAAMAGSAVELVAVEPDGPSADRALLELGSVGVGHRALLRGPSRALEAADVDLALGYLPDIRVVVAIGLVPAAERVAVERASWNGAAVLVVRVARRGGRGADPGEPEMATIDAASVPIILEAPASDPDGTLAGFIGVVAANLDGGHAPADAWAEASRALAVDRA